MKAPPPRRAFGRNDDLDVTWAWETFGGRTVEEVYEGFHRSAFPQVFIFRWIAPEAFIYYFPVLLRYICSDEAKDDADTISSLASILEFQLEENRESLSPVFRDIAAVAEYIISHYADYELEYDIYGDLKSRYEKIAKQVES